MKATIVMLPGDGIGPEVLQQCQHVLSRVASLYGHEFSFDEKDIGGIAIDRHANPLPQATLDACAGADAIMLGAVGGPKWDDPNAKIRPEQGLLGLRKSLDLYANLRPIRLYPALAGASPLKGDRLVGVDLLIVRELTGGIYFGTPRERGGEGESAFGRDTMVYSRGEVRRVAELAFSLAKDRRKRVTSVDKANVLDSSRLWREVVEEVHQGHADLELEHQLVDSAAMKLITGAAHFDVLLTGNMFGDILSDEASVLAGSLGLLPSASLGVGKRGLYEPIHGSAPDIAGQGKANPIGAIASAAMLLRHSLGLSKEASAVEQAITDTIDGGARTGDLTRTDPISTEEMGAEIAKQIQA